MNKTEHYNLNQWELHDRVMMQDFNSDNAKIDAALKAEADTRAAADTTEQTARKSADAALQTTLDTHTARIAKLGNCQIYTTAYTGNGQCGDKYPNSLTFTRKPSLVMIVSSENGRPLCMAYGCSRAFLDTNGTASHNNTVTWKGNTVSWYSEHVMSQMNVNGASYYVVMFSAMD